MEWSRGITPALWVWTVLFHLTTLSLASGQVAPPPEPTLPGETERRENPFEDHIETDRDSFTPSARTVGKSRLVIESAYSFEENRRSLETHSYPELLFRYGITERIELRLGWNYEVGGAGSATSSVEGSEGLEGPGLRRESRVFYGFKAQVSEQREWIPESSLIVQGFTPTSGEANDTLLVGTYVFGWEIAKRAKLDSALRYGLSIEEEDHFSTWAPSVVLRVPIGERWNVHAEYFGVFSRDRSEDFVRHFFSPGVHYLISPDFEVGVRLGWGLNDQSPRFFSNVGVGLRF